MALTQRRRVRRLIRTMTSAICVVPTSSAAGEVDLARKPRAQPCD